MELDWDEFEAALYDYSVAVLERMVEVFPNRTAYEFLVHCNADYGEVFYYLLARPPLYQQSDARFPGFPDHPPRKPDSLHYRLVGWEDLELELKRKDLADPRIKRWYTWSETCGLADFAEDHVEQTGEFLRRACRVGVKLEQAGELDRLSRESSFVLKVEDHDEVERKSWRRLIGARIELVPPWSSDRWPIAGRHPDIANEIFLFALEYQERGQLREAAHLLREALARLPELAGPAVHLVQGTDVLLSVPENTAWAMAHLAKVPALMFEPGAAEAVDKALELDPELAAGYYERAKLKFGPIPPDAIEMTVADLNRAIELDGSNAEYFAARAALRARPYYPFFEQAIQDYGRAHELDPANQAWLMRRAEAHVALQQYEAAIADFTQVFEMWDSEVSWNVRDALRGRAKCLQELGRYDEAIEEWSRLIAYEKYRLYFESRAQCRAALGDVAGAADDYLAASDLDR